MRSLYMKFWKLFGKFNKLSYFQTQLAGNEFKFLYKLRKIENFTKNDSVDTDVKVLHDGHLLEPYKMT